MDNPDRIILGVNAVREALLSPAGVEQLFLEKETKSPKLFELLKLARKARIPAALVPARKLDSLSHNGFHQGVVAFAPAKIYVELDTLLEHAKTCQEDPFLLIPEGVEDPQNLGALIRSALAAGVHGLLIPMTGSAGLTAGTERASAGALSHMDICRAKSMPAALTTLKQAGIRLIGLEAEATQDLWEMDLTGPLGIVLGGEDRGIRPHIRRELSGMARLPVRGPVGSLNVSATGAVALYEALRQRKGT